MIFRSPRHNCLVFAYLFMGLVCLQADYPEVRQLTPDDHIYRQIQSDIDEYYRAAAKGEPLPPLQLFTYRPAETISLYALASRFNLYYETIASLNRMKSPGEVPAGTALLIPNLPGLFLPLRPKNDLELMMLSRSGTTDGERQRITVRSSAKQQEFLFLPGQRFTKLELAFFLGILFRFPLPQGAITSRYGPRSSPVTGERHFHGGLDIAAPTGTDVFAARDGRVSGIGFDQILGTYCVLQHRDGYETIYAHLQQVHVELNQTVPSGMIIASVGSSGMSTGPHLHFEVRKQGETVDPRTLLPRVSQ